MNDRYKNENALMPDGQPRPRIVYPNDILPDENKLSQMSEEETHAEVKTLSSNPRDE